MLHAPESDAQVTHRFGRTFTVVEIMTSIALLVLALLAAQAALRGRARRRAAQLIRPADEWTSEDTQRWLDLIEPFPLHEAPETFNS